MRVFVAGGTGAIGRYLVPQLIEAGHEVVALARTPARANAVVQLGAQPVVADALRPDQLAAAVRQAEPDAVIHQLTALAGIKGNFRKFDQEFALTNQLRTEGTDTLLAAARAVGARRFIAQSFCGWPFERAGGPIKSEEDPLDPDPPASMRQTLAAIRHLETAIQHATGIEALALRYGLLYGPGTALAADGDIVAMVRKRRFPIVGDGGGIWSFLHVHDAAAATVAALQLGANGIYNVVDDEPAPVSSWLPHLARVLGAPHPRRVPVWLARILVGAAGVSMMTQIRGGSNAKAKRELAWQPVYASWRRGFAEGLVPAGG